MEKVYKVVQYNLIGIVLYTFKYMPELECVEDVRQLRKKYFYKGTTEEYPNSHLWELTTSLSKYKNLFNEDENTLLPYFADVTEDIPSSVKLQPQTYHNCQLMVEKHGGYLQFFHKETNSILRIAINSHIYQPVTNSVSLS